MDSNENIRWYDKDPLLKTLLDFLENAPDEMRISIAMDIIQIIIQEKYLDSDSIIEYSKNNYIGKNQRWYDANDITHSAIEMLKLLHSVDRTIILREVADTIVYFTQQQRIEDGQPGSGNRYLSDIQNKGSI